MNKIKELFFTAVNYPKAFFSALTVVLLILFQSIFSFADTRFLDLFSRFRIASQSSAKHPWLEKLSFLFPSVPDPEQIVLVALDDKSYLSIPPESLFNRRLWANTANYISRGEPKALGFNIFWGKNSMFDSEQDTALVDMVSKLKKISVVAGYRQENLQLGLVLGPPFPELARFGNYSAPYFYPFEERVRKVSAAFFPESRDAIPGFSVSLAAISLGLTSEEIECSENSIILKTSDSETIIPTTEKEYMLMNYCLPLSSFKSIPISEIYYERVKPDFFKDKIVIFGVHNSTEQNAVLTPLGEPAPKSLIHALAVYNIINRNFLRYAFPLQGLVTAVLILLLSLYAIYRDIKPTALLLMAITSCIFLISVSCLALAWFNLLLEISASVFVIVISLFFAVGQRFYHELSEKLRIRNAFQHYVTSSVVNEILRDPTKLVLHGEERNLTIFFSDIAGFTTLAEGMPPMEVVKILNEYLTEMTEIIFRYDGLLDKYEGDAIMSVFGAPLDQTDHAIRACRCAIENQNALRRLRTRWKAEGKPELTARIGINTGMVVVGNMGSKMRFDYTVIGDNVNLAARLESSNKIFGSEILVGPYTASLVQKAILTRKIGILQVAGRKQGTEVFEVLCDIKKSDSLTLEKMMSAKDVYEKSYDLMLKREFQTAQSILDNYLSGKSIDKPAENLKNRIEGFLVNPPPPEWEGTWLQEQK
ncbi:MAG: adenylate/guanylate cyclase domain-containing protein [Candidatus Riflebacteria bacterium]|nr:adenylate/guanylate cyclase domain-containing protein [Candidatus Riflebacteria bacterium]